ncbi:DNA-directed RNA polymerase subunit omega [Fusobacterium sp. PH5-44]|uniref:DNA-directed RNA polymerase subunit omega n=1 Tax=unclassified Fusobacterium TaxID=2648384 RepID=UPI003D1D54E3
MRKEIEYDDLLKEIPNKYVLTIVCGKRAREISKGSETLVKTNKKDTLVKKVLREVSEGKVSYTDEK